MRILVTNDDGWFAEGIQALQQALSSEHEVVVVAPDRNRSGMSNALTLSHTIRGHEHRLPNALGNVQGNVQGDVDQNVRVWGVEGTPVDCVHYALGVVYPLLGQPAPDLIVSGMNHGPNLGDDTLYSGTVAAAIEGRFLEWPCLATSVNARQPQYWDEAAQVVLSIVNQLPDLSFASRVLNINIPDKPRADMAGIKVTRLGERSRFLPPEVTHDTRGRAAYWIGAAGEPSATAASATSSTNLPTDLPTDFVALGQDYVTITPLQTDLTRHSDIPLLQDQLQDQLKGPAAS